METDQRQPRRGHRLLDDSFRVQLLVVAGVHPRIAQELLCRASSKTTMEIYSYVSAAQQREAVEVLQRALAEII